jgi:hypothetical protein
MRCEFSNMLYRNQKESVMIALISHVILGALFSVVFGSVGCAMVDRDTIQGSGTAKTETRELAPFTRIESTGSPDVLVTIGPKQSLTIEADDNILPVLTTEVKGDRLVIGSSESFSPKTPIKITITVAELKGAKVTGSGEINATGVTASDFEAEVTGSGDISVGGTANSLKAKVTGSGTLDATKLSVADAIVHVTGSGDAKVNTSKSLNATVTGSGDVQYRGNPSEITENVHGSGSVRKL